MKFRWQGLRILNNLRGKKNPAHVNIQTELTAQMPGRTKLERQKTRINWLLILQRVVKQNLIKRSENLEKNAPKLKVILVIHL